jgi:alkanesulfonate monooxygenase SsuD/methylene tetrahydromethanopterin reductase-like flavin-dependent oxidoreductase (luciferase family)
MFVWGDPDSVGEQLTEILATGIDGFTLSLPAQAHKPETVELLGATARKVVAL